MPLPPRVSSDFIAVIDLVHDVGQALKSSGGSRSRYFRLTKDFKHLERALRPVDSPTLRPLMGSKINGK